jgi:hypothetical protein
MATQLQPVETARDPLDDMSLPGWLYHDPEFLEAIRFYLLLVGRHHLGDRRHSRLKCNEQKTAPIL